MSCSPDGWLDVVDCMGLTVVSTVDIVNIMDSYDYRLGCRAPRLGPCLG
jgi:hypothetical protein